MHPQPKHLTSYTVTLAQLRTCTHPLPVREGPKLQNNRPQIVGMLLTCSLDGPATQIGRNLASLAAPSPYYHAQHMCSALLEPLHTIIPRNRQNSSSRTESAGTAAARP